MIQGGGAQLIAANARLHEDNAALFDTLRRQDAALIEQTATVRVLNLALARERGRRMQPKSGRDHGGQQRPNGR